MDDIDRSVVILRAKEPYRRWIMEQCPEIADGMTLESIDNDTPAFLVRTWFDNVDRDKMLREFWESLFEEALNAWITAEERWPRKRSLKMFREWFEVKYHSLVIDLCPWEIGE